MTMQYLVVDEAECCLYIISAATKKYNRSTRVIQVSLTDSTEATYSVLRIMVVKLGLNGVFLACEKLLP